MINNKSKSMQISSIIKEKINLLNPSSEDIFLIEKLIASYYRKRVGILNSAPETMATAFLQVYSKSNFLWQGDKDWSLQNLCVLFNTNSNTAGTVASRIIKALKINLWDERFCKKTVMRDNLFDKFVMDKSGFIIPKEMLGIGSQYSLKQNSLEEEFFNEAMDFLEQGEEEKAIEYLNKALAINENYIEVINELGLIYFDKDIEKSKEYYLKAVKIIRKELCEQLPKKLEQDIWENRPYLRAIHGLALILWRGYEIEEAKKLFVWLLNLNPNDNQGIRYCLAAIYKGLSWDDFGKIEDKCAETGNYDNLEKLLKEQNNFYKFWKCPSKENE